MKNVFLVVGMIVLVFFALLCCVGCWALASVTIITFGGSSPTASIVVVTATPPAGTATVPTTSPVPTTNGTGIILYNTTQNWVVESMTAVTHAHMPALQYGDSMRLKIGDGLHVINYGGINGYFVVQGPVSFCWTVDSDIARGGAGIYRLDSLSGESGWEADAKNAQIGFYPASWTICQ